MALVAASPSLMQICLKTRENLTPQSLNWGQRWDGTWAKSPFQNHSCTWLTQTCPSQKTKTKTENWDGNVETEKIHLSKSLVRMSSEQIEKSWGYLCSQIGWFESGSENNAHIRALSMHCKYIIWSKKINFWPISASSLKLIHASDFSLVLVGNF